ncbi:MAG: hypothetical protein FD187_1830 [bacterium]|nr:MAG: hypothetical protein FD142_1155 [bacterium]KAF0148641.1 MAG: hypothetical protein FD187_1830 [bacterium]KAF0167945.1 MAG: hypothetical protein FD158_1840 [bacterium]TXT18157.1 MAG: hypothetical protein FD132_2155 [bacterium]
MRYGFHLTATAALIGATAFTHAADFDGSKSLLCAPVQAIDCAAGRACVADVPGNLGAPNFMHIDFEKKVVVGPLRATPILYTQKDEDQLLLQGTELGFAWSLALDSQGGMTATLADADGAFVMFGSCTPK